MTTTDTMDTKSTIDQSMRMIDAGCEIVRITAPSIKEARNLEPIKDGLIKNGYVVPIVADIHFTPNAAIVAASIVEKVRINPGIMQIERNLRFMSILTLRILMNWQGLKKNSCLLLMNVSNTGPQ